MPIFVARQWVRHRMARLNEISGRYSVMKDEFYVPAGSDVSLQSEDNKQGRSDEPVSEADQKEIQAALVDGQRTAYEAYSGLLERGLARELARINLPVSLYTEWYWQIDLHNLFHFLKLRMDAHAQSEIRSYANVMFDLAKRVCPAACASFENHVLGSVRFSGEEWKAMGQVLAAGGANATDQSTLKSRLEAAAAEAGITGRKLERFLSKVLDGRQQ
jgi:thymidylate synthase (FAD)